MNTWYTNTKENDAQGLVIEEETGRNIAVTYDPRDALLVAAAPELLQMCKDMRRYLEAGAIQTRKDRAFCLRMLNEAITEAEGN